VLHGIGVDSLDGEGRIVACEFDAFWFVCVYTPNAQNELARIDHRLAWEDAFRAFLKNLEAGIIPKYDNYEDIEGAGDLANSISEQDAGVATALPLGTCASAPVDGELLPVGFVEIAPDAPPLQPKPVVVCGDLNVAHNDIDLKNPGPNRGNAGFSDEERGKFDELLTAGFTDTFRMFYPDLEGAYTWWSYQRRARANNAGWRIDYFLVSDSIKDKIVSADIYNEIMGSDHCPVGLDIEF
jgi:exodeoxyribonuclease-3